MRERENCEETFQDYSSKTWSYPSPTHASLEAFGSRMDRDHLPMHIPTAKLFKKIKIIYIQLYLKHKKN